MKTIKKIERFVGNVKFAVVIILAFAAYLTYGTFIESLYSTDYANRLVYKSLPFMLLQFGMFLSIFIATTLRFPYKKRLAGFYVLHLGLLLLFVGSFVTYVVGVDGNMELFPNTPTRIVKLPKYQLVVKDLPANKQFVMDLPYNPNEVNLDKTFKELKLGAYFPYAKMQRQWIKSDLVSSRSSHYLLKNENFTQDFLLSSHPDSEAKASVNLGPLNIHYLPRTLANCFASIEGQSKQLEAYILWDTRKDTCFRPKDSNSRIEKNQSAKDVLVFTNNNQEYHFVPGVSPLPVDPVNFQIISNSPMRVFSKKLFEERPHLFAFGDMVAFYDKDEQKWFAEPVKSSEPTPLPWMGFEISIIKDSTDTFPKQLPVFSPPKANKNRTHAVSVNYNNEDFWVTTQTPLRVGSYEVVIRPEQIIVPFQINLERFNMGTDPGTQNPASYESYVNVFDGQESINQKVFMNNPLDWDQFTFYQASYFPLEGGFYGSVFSVNYDPGRFLKYLGSLLLVLGSTWHFYLRKRKWRWFRS